MPGSYEDKFSGNRAFLGYMYAHPGKKLTFMGEEFGQFKEWDYKEGLEFFLLGYEKHSKLQTFYKELNHFYLSTPALYSVDDKWEGFSWIDADLNDRNIYSFIRRAEDSEVIAVINMSGAKTGDYFLKVPEGKYKVVFNSDMIRYGGSGKNKKQVYVSKKNGDKESGIVLNLEKLSFIYIQKIS